VISNIEINFMISEYRIYTFLDTFTKTFELELV